MRFDNIPITVAVGALGRFEIFNIDDIVGQIIEFFAYFSAFSPKGALLFVEALFPLGIDDLAMSCDDVLEKNPVWMAVDGFPSVEGMSRGLFEITENVFVIAFFQS